MPRSSISRTTREQARALRNTPTPPERALWTGLRELNRTGSTRFRRQAPIGPFIADFACFRSRLVIEVDGGQHLNEPRDRRRDAWLGSRGFTVLRFWNHEVRENREGVLQRIMEVLRDTPSG